MNNLLKTILIAIAIGLQIGCSNLAEENRDGYEDVLYRTERLFFESAGKSSCHARQRGEGWAAEAIRY